MAIRSISQDSWPYSRSLQSGVSEISLRPWGSNSEVNKTMSGRRALRALSPVPQCCRTVTHKL